MKSSTTTRRSKMCSNSNSGGDGCGGCGCTKKQKVQKVPQRGPGVAELEKILREQQKKEEDKSVVERFSSVSPLPHRFHHHSSSFLYPQPPPPPPPPPSTSLSSSNSLPRHVQLIQKLDLLCPPPSVATLNGANNKSAFVFPKNGYFPTMGRSTESNFNRECPKSDSGFSFSMQLPNEPPNPISPSTHLIQRKCDQYPQSTMNLYQFPASSSSASASAAMITHLLEHPSNQRSRKNYTSMRQEEEKMVGMKRPWPFSVEYSPGPFLHSNVPPFPSHGNRPHQSSISSNGSTFNSESKKTISRDTKWRGLSEPNSKKCNSDYGALDGNILTLGPPPTPSTSTQTLREEFSRVEFPLRNGSMEDLYQRGGPGGSVNQKPLCSFLLPNGQMGRRETTLSLDKDESEEGGVSIDLNLKL